MRQCIVTAVGVVLLLLSIVASLMLGQTTISFGAVFNALFHYDPQQIDHILVLTTRLSRTVIAIVVGASLAVAGALMQALTRNPLASPGIFGINAGAMFAIVLLSSLFTFSSQIALAWTAYLGAAVAGVMVYVLGTLGNARSSHLRIVLAGAAISALFISFTQALLVINQDGLDSMLFWLAGSVSGRSLSMLLPLLPYFFIALFLALLLARHLNILAAGDEIAKGLGQRTALVRALSGLCVIGLAGGAVAIAGNIGFVGLIVPHIVRRVLSADHRWLLPGCAIFGATLLLLADVVSRLLIVPQEVPVGAMTALLGAPFFIYLARRGMRHG
ncbi:iron ABC transporter permease [Pectobacterium versatile]|uniref:FecCD family ABC transporter permease n=1 Tax=Pectobacterium TaxID=122277 RepID=UPI00102EF4D0|nr:MULTISPECIES: iron ABC transporter permease [Pectobacterium]MBA0164022.1 iron ABC transporter permease [Pectobacterium versatile]MBD0847334.1 siderophore ABC transporter permease [Pectobacterium carotovorum subsp. carotovorum]MBK4825588.1 Iron(3+)-hydroxamate import system permease prot ein FhuB [Pectobacterium carotovorum subsp. carotovorum]MBN3059265.1 iron ABC transporter permease [Pectobacterium versatile]QUI37547.2 iron ABC transporter permease [Pectobacterium versatile]